MGLLIVFEVLITIKTNTSLNKSGKFGNWMGILKLNGAAELVAYKGMMDCTIKCNSLDEHHYEPEACMKPTSVTH